MRVRPLAAQAAPRAASAPAPGSPEPSGAANGDDATQDDVALVLQNALDREQAIATEHQLRLQVQRTTFDEAAAERAELERECNLLQSMFQQQAKDEDAVVKKWIALI